MCMKQEVKLEMHQDGKKKEVETTHLAAWKWGLQVSMGAGSLIQVI